MADKSLQHYRQLTQGGKVIVNLSPEEAAVTLSDAQAHMAKGTFVSHKSDQHIGFKLNRV